MFPERAVITDLGMSAVRVALCQDSLWLVGRGSRGDWCYVPCFFHVVVYARKREKGTSLISRFGAGFGVDSTTETCTFCLLDVSRGRIRTADVTGHLWYDVRSRLQ